MPRHPLTLPILSALALVGSGAGVFLGRSAIAEINPAYFSGPEPRFHADLSANPPSMDAPVHRAGALSAAELDQALGSGCVGCRTYPQEYFPVHDTDESGYRTGWASMDEPSVAGPAVQLSSDEPNQAELAERDAAQAEHAAALVRVHRYSGFAVATEPQSAAAGGPEPEPTPYASAELAID
jgi:hypothetical protein